MSRKELITAALAGVLLSCLLMFATIRRRNHWPARAVATAIVLMAGYALVVNLGRDD